VVEVAGKVVVDDPSSVSENFVEAVFVVVVVEFSDSAIDSMGLTKGRKPELEPIVALERDEVEKGDANKEVEEREFPQKIK